MPISAILFGGRRARTAPLIMQSFDWSHRVFVGASVASETTLRQDIVTPAKLSSLKGGIRVETTER